MPPPVAQAGRGRPAARGGRGRGRQNGRAETEPSRSQPTCDDVGGAGEPAQPEARPRRRRKKRRAKSRSGGPQQCDDVGGAEPAQPAARKKRRVEPTKRCTDPQDGVAKPAQGSSSSNPDEGLVGGDLLPPTAVRNPHANWIDFVAEHAQRGRDRKRAEHDAAMAMAKLSESLASESKLHEIDLSESSDSQFPAHGKSKRQASECSSPTCTPGPSVDRTCTLSPSSRSRTLSDASSTPPDPPPLDVRPPPPQAPTPRPRAVIHRVPMRGSVSRSSRRPQSARGRTIPTATRSRGQRRRHSSPSPRVVSPGGSQGGQTGSGRASKRRRSPQHHTATDGTHFSVAFDGRKTVTDGRRRRRRQEEPHRGSQRSSPSQRETTNCHSQDDLARSILAGSQRPNPVAIHSQGRRETFNDSQGQPAAPAAVHWQYIQLGLRVDVTLESMQLELMAAVKDEFAEVYFWRGKQAFDRVDNRVRTMGSKYKLCDLEENDITRPRTSNWSDKVQTGGGAVLQFGLDGRIHSQIQATLKCHAGEVRSWPTSALDAWHCLEPYNHCNNTTCGPRCVGDTCGPAPSTVGGDNNSTKIGATEWDRWTEPGPGWIQSDTTVFSDEDQMVRKGGCKPNLENAISRLAVWDEDGHRICVREQYGVTLAEVFDRFGDTQTYRTLLDEWSKGMLLIQRKGNRGTRAGKCTRRSGGMLT